MFAFGSVILRRPLLQMQANTYSNLSMTFGRPAIIPESYVKLEPPCPTMHIVGREPQETEEPQMDAMFFTAAV